MSSISKSFNLISRLKSNPITARLPLHSNLEIYGPNSSIESLVLIHIISVAEEILSECDSDIDLFDYALSSTQSLQIKDLQEIIDKILNV